jgi:hypothetical protein
MLIRFPPAHVVQFYTEIRMTIQRAARRNKDNWNCRTSAAAPWNFVWRGAELLNKNNTLPRLISPPTSNNITDSSFDPINQSGQESSRLLFSNFFFFFLFV